MVECKKLFESRGISLQDIGVNNFALDKTSTLEYFQKLFKEHVAILGGDVYLLKDGKLKLTYDNWYCNRGESESMESYVARSIDEAKTYIENYSDDTALFCLVLND